MPDRGYTALHLAANQGHTALIELLVGYGANMNATSHDGSTPLMIVLTEKRMEPLCSRTPHLQQVRGKLFSIITFYVHLTPGSACVNSLCSCYIICLWDIIANF